MEPIECVARQRKSSCNSSEMDCSSPASTSYGVSSPLQRDDVGSSSLSDHRVEREVTTLCFSISSSLSLNFSCPIEKIRLQPWTFYYSTSIIWASRQEFHRLHRKSASRCTSIVCAAFWGYVHCFPAPFVQIRDEALSLDTLKKDLPWLELEHITCSEIVVHRPSSAISISFRYFSWNSA